MAPRSRLFKLDGLIALSFFLTNLARTGWVEGTAKQVLIVAILLSIAFIITLFFTQRGQFALTPVGIVAVVIGFFPSVIWYLARFAGNFNLVELAGVIQRIYEFTNYASMAIMVVLLPYLFLKREK
jgi:hypothetical protein